MIFQEQFLQQFPVMTVFYTNVERDFESGPFVHFTTKTWPFLPIGIVLFYLLFIFLIKSIMRYKKPFQLDKMLALWNLFLSLFSFCGMMRTVPHLVFLLKTISFRDTLCLPPYIVDSEGACGFWKMLFVFSKTVELIDTVFLVLQKKKLLFLHVYHHATVLLLCWHAYVEQSSSGLYFMTMNYSIHTFMYGYYFLKSIDKWPTHISPKFITVAQILQMVIGAWICIMSCLYSYDGEPCSIYLTSLVPAGIVYTTYLLLFCQFFFQRFFHKKKSTSRID